MNDLPHASWAEVYDFVYEQSFGDFYREFTVETLQVITERVHAGARIVDFGAGTGRLSIPLSERGFEVTAVEPCKEMIGQLRQKVRAGIPLQTVHGTMQDFAGYDFDLALCVFTVLLYLLDEEALKDAFSSAYGALKPGGVLFLDIPSRSIFQSYSRSDSLLKRRVTVTEVRQDIYRYHEELRVKDSDGNVSTYADDFTIRYWPPEYVREILASTGFTLDVDLTERFSGTGSQYWTLKKP